MSHGSSHAVSRGQERSPFVLFGVQLTLYCLMNIVGGMTTTVVGAASAWLAVESKLGQQALSTLVSGRGLAKILGVTIAGTLLYSSRWYRLPSSSTKDADAEVAVTAARRVREWEKAQKRGRLHMAWEPMRAWLHTPRNPHGIVSCMLVCISATLGCSNCPLAFGPATFGAAMLLQGIPLGVNLCCGSVLLSRASAQLGSEDTCLKWMRWGQTALSISFCLGALMAPRLMEMALHQTSPRVIFTSLAGAGVLLAFMLLACPPPLEHHHGESRAVADREGGEECVASECESPLPRESQRKLKVLAESSRWFWWRLAGLSLTMFCILGSEMGASFAMAQYSEKHLGTVSHHAASTSSSIWDGILAGRVLLLPLAGLLSSAYVVLLPASLLCFLTAGGIAFMVNDWSLRAMCIAYGVFGGAIFPFSLSAVSTDSSRSRCARQCKYDAATAIPILLQAATLGEFCFPVIISVAVTHDSKQMMPVVLALSVLLAFVGIVIAAVSDWRLTRVSSHRTDLNYIRQSADSPGWQTPRTVDIEAIDCEEEVDNICVGESTPLISGRESAEEDLPQLHTIAEEGSEHSGEIPLLLPTGRREC